MGPGWTTRPGCDWWVLRRLWSRGLVAEYELGPRAANALRAENAPGRAYELRRVIVDRANHAVRRAQ